MNPWTADRLNKQAHRLDRRLRSVESVVAWMRAGNALHCYYVFGSPVWTLTNGKHIESATAEIVIKNPNVVPVGTTLFEGLKPQTYRYAET